MDSPTAVPSYTALGGPRRQRRGNRDTEEGQSVADKINDRDLMTAQMIELFLQVRVSPPCLLSPHICLLSCLIPPPTSPFFPLCPISGFSIPFTVATPALFLPSSLFTLHPPPSPPPVTPQALKFRRKLSFLLLPIPFFLFPFSM